MRPSEDSNSILNLPSDPYLVNVRANAKIRSWARNLSVENPLNQNSNPTIADIQKAQENDYLINCPLSINEEMRDQMESDAAFFDGPMKLSLDSFSEIITQILVEILLTGAIIERTNTEPIKAKFYEYNIQINMVDQIDENMIKALRILLELKYVKKANT